MAKVRNHHDSADKALAEGDFIVCILNAGGGFSGVVVEHSKQFLRMVAHEATTAVPTKNADTCLAWELLVPWSSIAWVKHADGRPDICDCLVK